MTDLTQTISGLINQSDLSDDDKEDFTLFLDGATDEELSQMIEMFTDRPDELISFWSSLKERLIFLQLLDENTEFSDEAKSDISERVSQMSDEEFGALTSAIQELNDGANPKEKMEGLSQEAEKNHAEFMTLTQEFLTKSQEYQENLKQDLQNEESNN